MILGSTISTAFWEYLVFVAFIGGGGDLCRRHTLFPTARGPYPPSGADTGLSPRCGAVDILPYTVLGARHIAFAPWYVHTLLLPALFTILFTALEGRVGVVWREGVHRG